MGWPPSSGVGIRTQRSSKQAAWLAQSQAAFCFIPYAWQTDLGPAFRTPDSESRNSSIPPGSGPRTERASYMVDGRLAKEERACLIPLDAADETRMGSPESGSPCPGGPAAGTMHASGASGDGWRSRWETRRISLRGGHSTCRQAHWLLQRSREAGASRMAGSHGACRKVHCLAVCGDWGPPQNASGRISALVDMPIIPLGGIPCGREPASATLFIQRFPNRFPPCGQAREIWKRMSAKLRRLHGLDLLFEPAI